ncbi:hypothetical protein, partial [Campylobacter coli]|uniref:hypothetical protein n=1 Tax=Campylobacter coli TaxID=195 RepID=UPI00382904FE
MKKHYVICLLKKTLELFQNNIDFCYDLIKDILKESKELLKKVLELLKLNLNPNADDYGKFILKQGLFSLNHS